MPQEDRFTSLLEALADGQPVDWRQAESTAGSDAEREVLAAFRSLAQVVAGFAGARETGGGVHHDPPRLATGDVWGTLRIVEHLGRGRFGDVYRAWDPALDREVALKLTAADDTTEPASLSVVAEARLMARVRHPGVVTVHGAHRIGGTTGLWMELVEGRTLETELAVRGPLPASEVAAVGEELAEALSAIHAAGLVHRDVKTSNVLRHSNGRVLLGDFGTGQEITSDTASLEGLAGTPVYLAPEIFRRYPATPQSDIYSLGVLLFRLASGGFPSHGRSLSALRDEHALGAARSVVNACPGLPAPLASIIDRALDVEPGRRFASAAEMARALKVYRSGMASIRRRYLFLGAAAAAIAGAAVWLGSISLRVPIEPRQRDWVLVGSIDNRTGNTLLDGTVHYALSAEVGASPVLDVVPQGRVEDTLALMRVPLDTRVNEQLAREVALRDGGIRAVLMGRIDLVANTYRFTTRVIDPSNGGVVATITESASGEPEVLSAVARLARRVRERLGEVAPALSGPSSAPLPRVTTASLQALDLYTRAQPYLFQDAEPQIAEQLLSAAVRQDPDFVMARVALAQAIWAQGAGTETRRYEFRGDEIGRHLAIAQHAANLLSNQERARVTAQSTLLQARISPPGKDRDATRAQAVTALEALHVLRPDDSWAVMTLLGIVGPQSTRVAPLAEKLVSLRPNSLAALVEAANRTAVAGEDDLARSYMQRAQPLIDLPAAERAGEGPRVTLLMMMSVDAWNKDDAAEALRLAERIDTISRGAGATAQSWYSDGGLSSLFLALGQLDRAEEIASRGLRYGIRLVRIGSVVASRRDRTHARAMLDRYDIDGKSPFAAAFVPMFAFTGRLADAKAGVRQQRRAGAASASLSFNEAWIARAEGNSRRVIALLEPLDASPELNRSNVLADAWMASGNPVAAVRVLERAAAEPRRLFGPAPFSAHHWLDQQDRLGILYRQVGRTADADRIDSRLRALLQFADADHPIRQRIFSTAH